jgi:Ni,Fe-hydrogenase III large subunit
MEASAAFIRERAGSLPEGPVRVELAPLAANSIAVSLVEGWRGEICHAAVTGPDGKFKTYKIVDPSFHNWMGLAMAMRGQEISDFPVCNKSFNLSYCGHDL